jgi:DNA-binding beta-propeller fold protein YncE
VFDEELATTIHRAQTAMRRGVVRVSGWIAVLLVGLLQPAFAHDPANYLFAASQTRPEITIIDSSTDEVVERITLPSVPGDMTALRRGRSLAIADRKASQVHFVDVLASRVEREMDVPLVPDVLRSDRTGTAIAAMDLSAGKVALGSIASGAFRTLADVSGATYIVFDAKGRLLVAHHAGATIVDATERRVVAELPVDNAKGPVTDIAVDPGSEYAFLEQPQEGILSIFAAHNARRVAVLHLPAPLGRIIPSEDSQFVLVPTGGKSISVVSTWTLNEKARARIGVEPDSVGLAFFQSVATIISQSKQEIILYDLWTNHLIGEIRLPSRPGLGAASSDGSKFYVALPDTGQVASINLASRRIDHLIDDVGVGVWTVVPAVGNGYCH